MDILDDILEKAIPITEIQDFDSKKFKKNFINKRTPVVLKGYANNWKALKEWDFDFMSNLNVKDKVRVEIGNIIQNEIKVEQVDFKTYIKKLTDAEANKDKDKPYLSMFNIFDYEPELLKSIDLSILTNHTKHDFPGAWIGPSGTISGLHWDTADNILTQIRGRKLLLIASPKFQKEVYPSTKYDLDSTGSLVDINNYDEVKFPKFKNVQFHKVILNPGDSLYVPRGWWHYVKSLDASISVSNFGYTNKTLFAYYMEFIEYRLHMLGLYKSKSCTCHKIVNGKRVAIGR